MYQYKILIVESVIKDKLIRRYKEEHSQMKIFEWGDEVNVLDFRVPLIIRDDVEGWLSKSEREQTNSPFKKGNADKQSQIKSYREIFFKDDSQQTRVFLLGEPGVGKTTFSEQLINLWCKLQESAAGDDYEQFLKSFEFVFLVKCRHAESSDSVLQMIIKQLFSEHDTALVKHVIFNKPEKCMVIIDGFDEWDTSSSSASSSVNRARLPDMRDVEGCTVLITSRPWRVETLAQNLRNCRVLEMKGLNEEGVISFTKIFKILGLLDSPSETFLREIENLDMAEIIKIPIMLVYTLYSFKENQTLERYKCRIYASLVESVLSHSVEKLTKEQKGEIEKLCKQKYKLPLCSSDKKLVTLYGELIEKLSKLAFESLVRPDKENSLVFEKKTLFDNFGSDELKACLTLGMLSESKAVSDSIIKKSSVSFLHKSVQEFLAAVHLSCNEMAFKTFKDNLTSLESIFNYSLVISFLCGMDVRKYGIITQHISDYVSHCTEFVEYRETFPVSLSVGLVQDLLLQCRTEVEYLSSEFDHASQQSQIVIPDVVLNEKTSADRVQQLCDLVCSQGKSTKSLVFEDGLVIPLTVVQSLHTMSKMEKLEIQADINNQNTYFELICYAIEGLKHLKSFSFSAGDESSVMKFTGELLLTSLGKLPSLLSLKLQHVDVSSDILSLPTNCKHLSLYHVSIPCIKLLPSLQTLRLIRTTVARMDVTDSLIPSSLSYLDMDAVTLSSSSTWINLCDYLSHTHLLTCIKICPSGHEDSIPIVLTLENNHKLENLELDSFSLESGLKIPKSPSLTQIVMSRVKMSAECWQTFVQQLYTLPSQTVRVGLYDVDIDTNSVSDIYKHFSVTCDRTDSDDSRNIRFHRNPDTATH